MFTLSCPQLTYCLVSLPDDIKVSIIETAKNRAHILRHTREMQFIAHVEPTDSRGKLNVDAKLEFGLQPSVGVTHEQFQQLSGRITQIEARLAQMDVAIANTRILSRNRHYKDRRPLQKYVSLSSHYAFHVQSSSLISLD